MAKKIFLLRYRNSLNNTDAPPLAEEDEVKELKEEENAPVAGPSGECARRLKLENRIESNKKIFQMRKELNRLQMVVYDLGRGLKRKHGEVSSSSDESPEPSDHGSLAVSDASDAEDSIESRHASDSDYITNTDESEDSDDY